MKIFFTIVKNTTHEICLATLSKASPKFVVNLVFQLQYHTFCTATLKNKTKDDCMHDFHHHNRLCHRGETW